MRPWTAVLTLLVLLWHLFTCAAKAEPDLAWQESMKAGRVARRSADLKLAEQNFVEASKAAGTIEQYFALEELAALHEAMGDYPKAAAEYEKVMSLKLDWHPKEQLVEVLRKMGEHNKSKELAKAPNTVSDITDKIPKNWLTKTVEPGLKSHWTPPKRSESQFAIVMFCVQPGAPDCVGYLSDSSADPKFDAAAIAALNAARVSLPAGIETPLPVEFTFESNVVQNGPLGSVMRGHPVRRDNHHQYQATKLLLDWQERSLGPTHGEVAVSYTKAAGLLNDVGNSEPAEKAQAKAAEIWLANKVQCAASRAALQWSGLNLMKKNQYAEAEKSFRQALAIAQNIYPADALEVFNSKVNLSNALLKLNREEEGLALAASARTYFKEAAGTSVQKSDQVVIAMQNHASALHKAGKFTEAEELFNKALDQAQELLPTTHDISGTIMNNLALLYAAQGQFEKAESTLGRSIKHFNGTAGKNSPELIAPYHNLTRVLVAQKKWAEAETAALEWLHLAERNEKLKPNEIAVAASVLGDVLYHQKKYLAAEPVLLRALKLKDTVKTQETDTADNLISLSLIYLDRDNYAKVIEYLKPALISLEKSGIDRQNQAMLRQVLALSYKREKSYDEAEQAYRLAIKEAENAYGVESHEGAQAMIELGDMYEEQGKIREAIQECEQALAIATKKKDDKKPTGMKASMKLALLYESAGDLEKAAQMYDVAIPLIAERKSPSDPNVVSGYRRQARLLRKLGRNEKAEELEMKVAALKKSLDASQKK